VRMRKEVKTLILHLLFTPSSRRPLISVRKQAILTPSAGERGGLGGGFLYWPSQLHGEATAIFHANVLVWLGASCGWMLLLQPVMRGDGSYDAAISYMVGPEDRNGNRACMIRSSLYTVPDGKRDG
jgi:hypothetical protein